jgi:hypothetical protein
VPVAAPIESLVVLPTVVAQVGADVFVTAAAPIATQVQVTVLSVLVDPSVVGQVGADPADVPAMVHLWVLPLESSIRFPWLEACAEAQFGSVIAVACWILPLLSMHDWPAAAPSAIRAHTTVPSVVVELSVRPQVGVDVPVVPAVVTFCVFPLLSTIKLPIVSTVDAVHCGEACTSHDGSHKGSAPATAKSGADPTSPMTAELTTWIGTGPTLYSKTSTP